jgi:hypothetical protein
MPKKAKKSSVDSILKTNERELDYTPFKPTTQISLHLNAIIAFAIFVFTLCIYQMTNAKTVSFWDAGEYIATSSIFGIPHPPGNPFYIILGRFFCIFSFGVDHAAVVSFISSFFSALGVMFTYLITVLLISMWTEKKLNIIAGGIIAALLTAFSFSYWMNAVEAAVYGLSACIINLVIWITMVWVKKQKDFSHQNILILILYLLFLGFCVHQTVLQIAPAILLIVVLPFIKDSLRSAGFWLRIVAFIFVLLALYFVVNAIGGDDHIPDTEKFALGIAIMMILWWYLRPYVDHKMWLLLAIMVLIGFSPHIFLVIRSAFRPFINEGHPHNLEMFMDYVLRKQYGGYNFLDRRASFTGQFGYHFTRYMSWQFMDTEVLAGWLRVPRQLVNVINNAIITSFGLYGFYYAYRRNKYAFWYLFSLFFMTSVAMIFVMNLSGSEVRDRDYFFVSAYNMWAIAMGLGAVGVLSLIRASTLRYMAIAVLMLYPALTLTSYYHKHDRSHDYISLGYGLNILNSLEKNAIVFTNGDNDTFPLWYAQAVADRHAFENIYPATNVHPTVRTLQLIDDAMQWKTGHIYGIRPDVTVANLSLLNTPWYIKQLRDMDGVEINLSDQDIARMRPQILRTGITANVSSPNGDRFTIEYPAGTRMAVKDFAVARIIQDNFGKRPIYFAITCSDFTGFDDYLINEGMVNRLVATPGDNRLDYQRLKNNLNNVYFYKGIFDDRLYKDSNMLKLITNYCAAFLRLSDHYYRAGDLENALHYYERGVEYILNPDERRRSNGMLAILYAESGRTAQGLALIEQIISDEPDVLNHYVLGAVAMIRSDDSIRALDFIERGFVLDPNSRQLLALTIQYAMEYDMRQEAHDILARQLPESNVLKYRLLEMILDPDVTLDDF